MNDPTKNPVASKPPRVVHTIAEMRTAVREARRAGKRIGLVPTMGALHAGHLSLVEASKGECEFHVVTIFVNPTQFSPAEDFSRYPRTLAGDVGLLAPLEVDLVFAPAAEEIYPSGFSTYIEPPAVAAPLEGRCRPGHFRGVCTVVLKLFEMIGADVAYFGQKDFQQALVIRRMVEDLNLPLRIDVRPTVREADGLAMSSRNRYLTATERATAVAVSRGLRAMLEAVVERGEQSAAVLLDLMHATLAEAGITRIDYVSICDAETLAELREIVAPAVALVACHVGKTRLIDNMRLA